MPVKTSKKHSPGDVVQLRSGGPIMTVKGLMKEGRQEYVYCDWFFEGRHDAAAFHENQLISAEAPSI